MIFLLLFLILIFFSSSTSSSSSWFLCCVSSSSSSSSSSLPPSSEAVEINKLAVFLSPQLSQDVSEVDHPLLGAGDPDKNSGIYGNRGTRVVMAVYTRFPLVYQDLYRRLHQHQAAPPPCGQRQCANRSLFSSLSSLRRRTREGIQEPRLGSVTPTFMSVCEARRRVVM